jgi:hypothetical protein
VRRERGPRPEVFSEAWTRPHGSCFRKAAPSICLSPEVNGPVSNPAKAGMSPVTCTCWTSTHISIRAPVTSSVTRFRSDDHSTRRTLNLPEISPTTVSSRRRASSRLWPCVRLKLIGAIVRPCPEFPARRTRRLRPPSRVPGNLRLRRRRSDPPAQAEVSQDEQHDHDDPDDIEDVHVVPLTCIVRPQQALLWSAPSEPCPRRERAVRSRGS